SEVSPEWISLSMQRSGKRAFSSRQNTLIHPSQATITTLPLTIHIGILQFVLVSFGISSFDMLGRFLAENARPGFRQLLSGLRKISLKSSNPEVSGASIPNAKTS